MRRASPTRPCVRLRVARCTVASGLTLFSYRSMTSPTASLAPRRRGTDVPESTPSSRERRKNMTELQTQAAPFPISDPWAAAACGSIALERNLFFTGKLMTARDFRDETAYLRSRLHLHNRLFVGTG